MYVLNGKRGDLDFGSRYGETKALFLSGEEFSRLWESRQAVFLVTGPQVRDSDVQSLPREKSFLMGQFGSRRLYTNKPTP